MMSMYLVVGILFVVLTHEYAVGSPAGLQADSPQRTIKITTILAEPFVMKKESTGEFEGYIVDLVEKISKLANFKYEFKLAEDGKYGMLDPKNHTWNGMIGELLNKRADMAAADLTITSRLERILDFSKPFMNTGIGIVMKRPDGYLRNPFAFLTPFSSEVWISVFIAYIIMSLVYFVIARFAEWNISAVDGGKEENKFSCANSFWYLFGSPGNAGCQESPRSLSVRILSATWWIFSFFIFGTYIAKLFPFLTVSREMSPIQNVEDLSKQTYFGYGTIYGGSTWQFFRMSKIDIYERMFNFMMSNEPSAFVNSTKEGFERVKKGHSYAFITEAHAIKYHMGRDCSYMKVGQNLDSKGLGFAFPIGSPLKQDVSLALLRFQEDQSLQVLYNKWFRPVVNCESDSEKSEISGFKFGIREFHPLFGILVGGLALALIVGLLEFIYQARTKSQMNKVTFCDQFSSNIRQSVQSCCSSSRVVKAPATTEDAGKLTELSS